VSNSGQPLVSVLTPVYNGDAYLAECIDSVLAQTWSNWEYIIVNNHSTDGTLAIAERYAALDRRIRVYSNEALLDIIANHNRAFRLASAESKYCKIVSADDWIFPECLERMVQLAETHPSIGIVGSYQMSGGGKEWADWCVKWDQVPYPSTLVAGRDIGRIHMLGGPHVFGNPTSLMYRADLVRKHDAFYPNPTAEADTSACCRCLQESDYGFVHQVLSYERVHNVRMTARSQFLNAYLSSEISDLQQYGGIFLSPEELRHRVQQLMTEYYEFLAVSVLNFRKRDFWEYHETRLKQLGYPLNRVRLSRAIIATLAGLLVNPKRTIELVRKRLRPAR
jgi:glycosyltransferase involved in cell wall biosynthesis